MSIEVYCRKYEGEKEISCRIGSGRHALHKFFDNVWFIIPKNVKDVFSGYNINSDISSVDAEGVFCFTVYKDTDDKNDIVEKGRNLLCFGDEDRMYEELDWMKEEYEIGELL